MNIYHDALLVWSFRKALQAIHLPNAMSYYEHFQSTKQSDHAGMSKQHQILFHSGGLDP